MKLKNFRFKFNIPLSFNSSIIGKNRIKMNLNKYHQSKKYAKESKQKKNFLLFFFFKEGRLE